MARLSLISLLCFLVFVNRGALVKTTAIQEATTKRIISPAPQTHEPTAVPLPENRAAVRIVALGNTTEAPRQSAKDNEVKELRTGPRPLTVLPVVLEDPGYQVSSAVHLWLTVRSERTGMMSPARFTADGKIHYYPDNGESMACESVDRKTFSRIVDRGLGKCSLFLDKLIQDSDMLPKFSIVAEKNENRNTTNLIPGTTMFMFLKSSSGNIAHFAGRVLAFEHFLVHAQRMGLAEMKNVDRIIIQASAQIRFMLLRDGSWHNGALRAVVGPTVQVYNSTANDDLKGPGVYILPDRDSLDVTFERVILPSFLKGRYFVSDSELPGSPRELVNGVERPSTASHWLANVHRLFGRDSVPVMKKKLVYLRRITRRAFTAESESRVVKILRDSSRMRGLEYEEVVFSSGMTFEQQIGAVETAAVAVGMHGANLVAAMALPRGASMIEIFPFGWKHEMYVEAGRAGVEYSALNISTGHEFPALDAQYGGDRYQCMTQNPACKNFYRSDIRPVDFPIEDDSVLKSMLLHSMDHALLSLEGTP